MNTQFSAGLSGIRIEPLEIHPLNAAMQLLTREAVDGNGFRNAGHYQRRQEAARRCADDDTDDKPERFEIGPIIYEEQNRKCPLCGSHNWIYQGEIATCYPLGHVMPRFKKKEIQKNEDASLPPSGADSAA